MTMIEVLLKSDLFLFSSYNGQWIFNLKFEHLLTFMYVMINDKVGLGRFAEVQFCLDEKCY